MLSFVVTSYMRPVNWLSIQTQYPVTNTLQYIHMIVRLPRLLNSETSIKVVSLAPTVLTQVF
jgi:hypothetical protein